MIVEGTQMQNMKISGTEQKSTSIDETSNLEKSPLKTSEDVSAPAAITGKGEKKPALADEEVAPLL